MTEIHFFSFMPRLHTEVGHIHNYQLGLMQAVKQNGWDFTAFVTKDAQLPYLPSCWHRTLANDFWNKKSHPFSQIKHLIKNFFFFRRFLQHLPHQKNIFFFEHGYLHLVPLFFTLLQSRKKVELWILLRFPFDQKKMYSKVLKRLIFSFKKLLGEINVKCLTDSKPLSKEHLIKFNTLCIPVPIPIFPTPPSQKGPELSFWWPSGSIRLEQGRMKILHIYSLLLSSPENIALVLSDKMQPFLPPKQEKTLLISSTDYPQWLTKADLILLPYDEKIFRLRTSNIFVEAILSGTIPAVTKKTWMAQELQRFDLKKLIINWDDPDLIKQLKSLIFDDTIQKNLKTMQAAYREYHSIESFAQVLKNINDF